MHGSGPPALCLCLEFEEDKRRTAQWMRHIRSSQKLGSIEHTSKKDSLAVSNKVLLLFDIRVCFSLKVQDFIKLLKVPEAERRR